MVGMKGKLSAGVDGGKLSKNFWTYSVLLAALGAMTFFGVCDPSGKKFGRGGSSGAAATVAGDSISRNEFQRAYGRIYQQYQRMYQDAFDPGQMRLAHSVLRQLVEDHVLYAKAVEFGLRASDTEIVQMLTKEDGFKGENGKFSDEIFNRFLQSNAYTEASFMDEIRRSVTLQKFRRFTAETVVVSDKAAELDYRMAETKLDLEYLKLDPQAIAAVVPPAEIAKLLADPKGQTRVKEAFTANAKDYNRPEQVEARHLLVSFKGARNATADAAKRDKEAARLRATDLLAQVNKADADFAAIASANTDEPAGKAKAGGLGWFSRDAMDKAFSDAAFALNKGQISGLVETPFGFHIIQTLDKKPALNQPLEQVQMAIAESLLAKDKRPQMAQEQAQQILTALQAGQPSAPLLITAKAAWASTGEVQADARYLPGIGSSKEVSDALVALNKPGQLYPKVVDVRGNLYILRLKSRREPDLTKFDQDKRRETVQAQEYAQGNSLFSSYQKQFLADVDKQQKIWLNPDLLALDEAKAKDGAGG